MKSHVTVDAGICNFKAAIHASSDDDQNVTFTLACGCEKVRGLGKAIVSRGPIDAYQEIDPAKSSTLMTLASQHFKGGCSGCPVSIGLFKAMQVAAGLALAKDASIRVTKSSLGAVSDRRRAELQHQLRNPPPASPHAPGVLCDGTNLRLVSSGAHLYPESNDLRRAGERAVEKLARSGSRP